MQEAKHTPGPWGITGINRDGFYDISTQHPDYHADPGEYVNAKSFVCDVAFNTGYSAAEHGHANALLISAAPQMFDALRQVLAWCASPADTRTTSDIEDIVADALHVATSSRPLE